MRALLRALLAVVGVLALIVVGAVVYITTFFDPNDLKPRLVEAVRDQSGLELNLDGPLSWSFYPRLGFSVEQAEAWLPEQSHDDSAFAAFDRAEVSVAFAPLLSGEVAVEGLTLDGMRLNLERNAEGRGNWEVLLDRMERGGDQAEEALAPASAGPGLNQNPDSLPVALDIASVQVRDSRVHYQDAQRDLDLTLSNLSLDGSNVNPDAAFPLQMAFDLDSKAPELTSEVKFKSRVRLGLRDGRYELSNVTLETSTQWPALSEQAQGVNLQVGHLLAETQAQHYRLDDAKLDTRLHHPAVKSKPLGLSLGFDGEADLDAQTAQLRDIALSGDDNLDLTGTLSFTELFEAPQYTGQLKLAPLPLRDWLKRFDALPETGDDKALSELAMTSPVHGDLQRINFSNLSLLLDGETLTGELGAGFDGQWLSFDLQGERLDLDTYLPPAEKDGEEADKNEDTASVVETLGVSSAYAAAESAGLLPAEWLSNLTLDGKLDVNTVILKGMTLQDVALRLAGDDGRQRLESLAAKLYEGTLDAQGSLDLRQSPLRLAMTQSLSDVQIAPLYKDINDAESPLRGRLNLESDVTSQTNQLESLKRHLNGTASLRIDDGAMLDVNVSRQLCTAAAVLDGNQSEREWSDDTPFDTLSASLEITDGVARNDDLEVRIPGIEMTGAGSFNIPTERFDYDLKARFIDTADENACRVTSRLQQVRLPVRCKGQLGGEPGEWCRFDREAFQDTLGELAEDKAKREAGEKLDEELEEQLDSDTARKIDETLGEGSAKELGDKLRGLLK
ncbi:AsmA family protein [Chromohalobacter canadensis]|uniref:AsmA family protein n=1 Tax=Chromohalobacter canadensis TaxID=141389 RepID=UPI0021C123DD|nr:AsmA family protein [Chromohalobacter canadensis]MCT8466976.1 AsmA family protein [Chromohalobacter canadensis]MCT8471226.1 AsmA family protein [Chromohalobacter canadensis]MCT8497523.1 AsmA family protein [Chromohalobacter canadensis]